MKNCPLIVDNGLPTPYTTSINTVSIFNMKPYPLGLDNPYVVRQVMGTTRWAIYRKEDFQKVATFRSQFDAYDCRRSLLKFEGYNA